LALAGPYNKRSVWLYDDHTSLKGNKYEEQASGDWASGTNGVLIVALKSVVTNCYINSLPLCAIHEIKVCQCCSCNTDRRSIYCRNKYLNSYYMLLCSVSRTLGK
jgi:hypothetical protein